MAVKPGTVLCIMGLTGDGKTATCESLDSKDTVYFNLEPAGNPLPFLAKKLRQFPVADPKELIAHMLNAANSGKFKTIIIDSQTVMMSVYEVLYVSTASPKEKWDRWADYGNLHSNFGLVLGTIKALGINIVVLNHMTYEKDEDGEVTREYANIKGASAKIGIAAAYTNIMRAKRMPTGTLQSYKNPLLKITEDEEDMQVKYVLQTKPLRGEFTSCICATKGVWGKQHAFIDGDAKQALEYLNKLNQ